MSNARQRMPLPFLRDTVGFSKKSTEHFFPSGELPNFSKLPPFQVVQATLFYSSTRRYWQVLQIVQKIHYDARCSPIKKNPQLFSLLKTSNFINIFPSQ